MSFYRRYGDLLPGQLPLIRTDPARIAPALVGGAIPARAPIPASLVTRTESLRLPMPRLPVPERTRVPLERTVLLVANSLPVFPPQVFRPAAAPIDRSAVMDDRAAAAAQAARAAAKDARNAEIHAAATANTQMKTEVQASFQPGARPYVAPAQADTVAAAHEAQRKAKAARKAELDAEKAQAEADHAAQRKAKAARKAELDAEKAAREATEEAQYPGAVDPSRGWARRGGSVPDYAWDQVPDEPSEAVPLPDGTVVLVPKKPTSPVLAAAAAGAAGFFLGGGPIGGLIGLAAGYFLAKPKRVAAQVSLWSAQVSLW